MAGTLQSRIQVYTGTISDTTNMTDLINAAIRSLVNIIPESKVEKYASASTDSGSGIDISSIRPIRAHKNGYRARRVDAGLKVQVLPAGSLSNIFVVNGGSGYSLNDVLTLTIGGTSGTCKVTSVNSGVVTGVEVLTSGTGYSLGISNTTVAPAGGTGCTLYVIPTNGSIHQATSTDPVWYMEGNKVYIIPSGGTLIGLGFPTGISHSSTTIAGFPIEWEQAVILDVVIQELLYKNNVNYDALVALAIDSVSAPTPPSDASFTFTNASYTNASYVDGVYTPASIDTTAETTIGSLGTPPTYLKPSINMTAVPDALSLSGISIPSAPADFALSISATPPSVPSAPAITYTNAVIGAFDPIVIGPIPTPPTYTKPTNSVSFTNISSYIATKQDLEKAQTEIQHQVTVLNSYNADIINELNKFNSQIENQKLSVQHIIRQAELFNENMLRKSETQSNLNLQDEIQNLNAAIANYQAVLGKYNGDLTRYQQIVNAEVSVYSTNLQKYSQQLDSVRASTDKAVQEYRTNLERWQTQRNTELNQYASDIQNEFNEFTKELKIYESTVQTALKQADLTQDRLREQSLKVVELNKFNAQQAIQTALQNEQQSLVADIQNKAKAAEVDILNKTKTVDVSIEQYKANLELFMSKLNMYASDINKAVQKYSLNIQKYLGAINSTDSIIEQCRKEYQQIVSMI